MKFKNVLMFMIATAATLLAAGFPTTATAAALMGITVLGTTATYIAKSEWFPSISLWGMIDLRDLVSGLILAIGTGLTNFAASWALDVPIVWSDFKTLIWSVVVGYFSTKFLSQAKKAAILKRP